MLEVRWEGLEPSRLAAHGPQPCLSANSSTTANKLSVAHYTHPLTFVNQHGLSTSAFPTQRRPLSGHALAIAHF